MMGEYKLIAKIKSPELLFQLAHELGSTFYTVEKGKYKVIYFSGRKIILFDGEMDENYSKRLEMIGYRVSKIKVDEEEGMVYIEE